MKMTETLLKSLQNMKGKWTLLLLLLGGLFLLLLGGQGAEDAPSFDSEAYRAALTAEVTALCREVRGVGEVSVLLTLTEGESYTYAGQSGYISAGGSGLLLSSRPPQVAGVAVVCEGGGSAAVREELKALLSSALGIGAHRVTVTAKK